ncbi:MAG: rod shape-determining protein MreC [candidate division Zixibacteria bacterium]|nr:rod shape-determining protein MreC [candidate division Zixibacteria bacterium]
MDWQSSWLKEKQTLVHTIIAFLLAFILLLAGNNVAGFVGNVTNTVFYYPFNQLKSSLSIFSSKSKTIDDLNTKLAELTVHLQLYNEIVEENKRLRALLGFIPPESFRIVPTEIIGVSGTGIPNTILINLGASDSVRVNQTVINQSGLAGRIAQVMDDYSVVYLLSEPRCRVSARVSNSREQGIIRYKMSRGMYLDNCPQQGEVTVGDTVITSGLGGIFPEGIVIGTIEKIDSPEKEFFHDITIKPVVNFNGLDELYVLVWER